MFPVRPHGGILLLLLFLSGCVRREGRNSDCMWPAMVEGRASVANERSLRADLEFAEELAIRYMDAHAGPRDPAVAAQAKNRCMGLLLGEIGKERGITAQEAFRSFGKRSVAVDLAMGLPFFLCYALGADLAIRRVLGRYPPAEGWMISVLLIVLAGVGFGAVGLVLGQQWWILAESLRVGTQHLSNRVFSLPIHKHPSGAYLLGLVSFYGIAVFRYWLPGRK